MEEPIQRTEYTFVCIKKLCKRNCVVKMNFWNICNIYEFAKIINCLITLDDAEFVPMLCGNCKFANWQHPENGTKYSYCSNCNSPLYNAPIEHDSDCDKWKLKV